MTGPGLALALLLAASPFKAEHPEVRDGNARLRAGDPAAALQRYDRAEAEAGAHPEIDLDRGDALWAKGQQAEAREAWRKAAEAAKTGPVASKAWQNEGNAADAAGDREGAVRAFAEALRRDPANEDARYNLEVLLRRKAAAQQQQQQQQQQQDKKEQRPDQKDGQGQPQPKPQDQQGQQGQQDRKDQQQQGQGQQAPPQGGEGRTDGEARKDGQAGAARAGEIDRQDAERLLDALRAREKGVPLQATQRKDGRRRDVAKDW